MTGLLVYGQNNQTSKTILEGGWMDSNGPGFKTLLTPPGNDWAQFENMLKDMGTTRRGYAWEFKGNRYSYMTFTMSGVSSATREILSEGTFVINTANKRLTYQYVVDTITTSDPDTTLKRLQLKASTGEVYAYYSY
jgi:hypothetical protein